MFQRIKKLNVKDIESKVLIYLIVFSMSLDIKILLFYIRRAIKMFCLYKMMPEILDSMVFL